MGSSESTERSMQEGNSSSEPPPEANKKDQMIKVAGVAVAAVAVASGISSLLSGTKAEPQENKKMMKAPGKDGYIVRDDFEGDPKTYFKNLRKGS